MQRASQGDGQQALTPAERAGPGEAALVGVRELLANAIDHGGRGRVADIAGKCVGAADVGVDVDGALVLTRNLNDVREHQLLLISHRPA